MTKSVFFNLIQEQISNLPWSCNYDVGEYRGSVRMRLVSSTALSRHKSGPPGGGSQLLAVFATKRLTDVCRSFPDRNIRQFQRLPRAALAVHCLADKNCFCAQMW